MFTVADCGYLVLVSGALRVGEGNTAELLGSAHDMCKVICISLIMRTTCLEGTWPLAIGA